jgi:hypothetical protein
VLLAVAVELNSACLAALCAAAAAVCAAITDWKPEIVPQAW